MIVFTWAQREYWPDDEPGKIFLGWAVHRVGKWLHGEEWLGTEPQVPPVELPPHSGQATYSEQGHARDLLAEFRPDMGEPEFEPESGRLPARRVFSDSQWSTVAHLSKLWSEDRKFRTVKREIQRLAKSGMLRTYWQDDLGDFQEIKKNLWTTNRFYRWVSLCHDPAFADEGKLAARCWIFVDQEKLETLLARPAKASGVRTGTGRKGFKDRLRDEIQASPRNRTMTRGRIIDLGTSEFRLSRREASRMRDEVIDEFPDEVQEAWRRHGPLSS